MGLFSSPPQLRDDIRYRISPYFFTDDVANKLQEKGKTQVAKSQDALLKALVPGEVLSVIIPCFEYSNYECLGVVTSNRIIQFKGNSMLKEFPRSSLGQVKKMITKAGLYLLVLNTQKAAPFAHSQPGTPGFEKYTWGHGGGDEGHDSVRAGAMRRAA